MNKTTSESVIGKTRRVTVPEIARRKGGEPVVCLTAYTAPMAKLLDQHVDLLLVGDSMGMALYGMPSTLGVTLEMSIAHGAAVMRGSRHACVIVDMPWGTYQESPVQAYRNAARVMAETGCAGVKIEGGVEMAETVKFLTERGIPVMGHIGLQPQSLHAKGGFLSQGHTEASATSILADAKAISASGAFSIVIEAVVELLARQVTEAIPVVTIGIGASPSCDGQILVSEDAMGMFPDFSPKFVKRFADIGEQISKAAADYAREVRARTFPAAENLYGDR